MAERRDGDWFAVCIDLDIAVQGQSFVDVRQNLQQAIKLYVERVSELPEAEQARLLNRRSPWHIRAKFALLSLLIRVRKRDEYERQFTLPVHVPA
jgi:predicted RNase H-like HicB family nuclease